MAEDEARRSYEFIEAIAETERNIQEAVDRQAPRITRENYAAFQAGDLPMGRFDIKDSDRQLTAAGIATALTRAKSPEDVLYCRHAAVEHPKTYQEVIDVLLDQQRIRSRNVEFRRTDAVAGYEYIARRLILEGTEQPKIVYTPAPFAAYYTSFRAIEDQPEVLKENVRALLRKQKDIHPLSTLMSAIYAGLRPFDIVGGEPRELGRLLAGTEIKENIRKHVGKLDTDKILEINLALRYFFDNLLVEEEETWRPSYDPTRYDATLDYLVTRRLLKKEDRERKEFQFVEQEHVVTARAIFRGISEIAQEMPEARKLHGDARTTELLARYGNEFSTELVTAYFEFQK